MAATARQVFIYNFHVQVCQRLGIVQSTVRHKTLQGSISAPSTKGNIIYTGAGPDLRDSTVTTDSLVWAIWEPLRQRGDRGDDAEPGRTSVPYLRGQCPLIDDNLNQVNLAQDDWLEDAQNRIYRIDNPTMSNDLAFWAFSLEFYR